jgi:hypothetical protein
MGCWHQCPCGRVLPRKTMSCAVHGALLGRCRCVAGAVAGTWVPGCSRAMDRVDGCRRVARRCWESLKGLKMGCHSAALRRPAHAGPENAVPRAGPPFLRVSIFSPRCLRKGPAAQNQELRGTRPLHSNWSRANKGRKWAISSEKRGVSFAFHRLPPASVALGGGLFFFTGGWVFGACTPGAMARRRSEVPHAGPRERDSLQDWLRMLAKGRGPASLKAARDRRFAGLAAEILAKRKGDLMT